MTWEEISKELFEEKTGKRFYVEKSENQDTIFDDEGIDDYYHLGNDTRDVNALCRLLNELHEENQRLKRHNEDLIIYLEQANSTDKLADDKND